MKRFLFFLFWIAVIVMAMYQASSSKTVQKWLKDWTVRQKTVSRTRTRMTSLSPRSKSVNSVTLYLKNGSVISGELVQEGGGGVTLLWQGGRGGIYKE